MLSSTQSIGVVASCLYKFKSAKIPLRDEEEL